ncbi:PEP/pyruvate-binding domain-containing protein [Pseudodesulfovibrio senegalensis]|uniref:Phosphoenolpyruvate synthase n=1 Tax=Pseudodesulfovibrio senegalensis TaxID=1721087 RepID=A0A6N6N1S4_9BACT|nr:PEP/pyruvate-binding domain-containing protein [Pseudodesulfovibrio senegalensis]KAB1441480.1 pyruvate, water dikinase [Pseudodesulfovibrio senegalensis]
MFNKELFKHWTYQVFSPGALLRTKYNAFKDLLRHDTRALELIADLEGFFYGHELADRARINRMAAELSQEVKGVVDALTAMSPARYVDLPEFFKKIDFYARMNLQLDEPDLAPPYVLELDEVADRADQAGGKAANLAAVRTAGIPTPPGFVITANAFHYFMESNELRPRVEDILSSVVLSDSDGLLQAMQELQELILAAEVPEDIAHDILEAVNDFMPEGCHLAVRSSALAEDGNVSFAGQYASELNVSPDEVLDAYKRVLAGKYCPRAVTYRIRNGLSDADTAMAVLVLPMLDAEAAGVVYTDDPACPALGGDAMGVYAVQGLADGLVDGSRTPDKYFLSREEKPRLLEGCAQGGVLLPEPALLRLGEYCSSLETIFNAPQDVEWVMMPGGGISILQTRPLQQEKDEVPEHDAKDLGTVLYSGLERASGGAGCGEVFPAATGEEFAAIPQGAVVVTPTLRPALTQFMDRIAALVAAQGSRASHFASVAREHGVPVLVDSTAAQGLTKGRTVTVDAVSGAIMEGCVSEVLRRANQETKAPEAATRPYKSVIPHTVKLTLTDPEADNFTPEGCRSLHDIVRFAHEKSVAEMFSLVDKRGRGMTRAKKLKTDLPLVMYVLDLGGGLFGMAGDKDVITPDDIVGRPMWALWFGLSDSRIAWDRKQTHMDWEEFDRISGGIFKFDSQLLASYAIISDDYLHLMVRFGYHFSVVDSVCGPETGSNYINFRFKGGGAGFDQRLLRLRFIRKVLEYCGFETSSTGDMIDASVTRLDESAIQRLLARLGYLLAATRLMDMALRDEEQVDQKAEEFIQSFENKN